MHILNKTNIDFLRWRWHAVVLSWVVILAGLGVIATRGLPRGIEFAGGTSIIVKFDQNVAVDQVRSALDRSFGGDTIIQPYAQPEQHQFLVRVPQVGAEKG